MTITVAGVKRKHPLAECEKCPLANKAIAYTTGPADAKLAVVSRSPGWHEAQAGKSFAGPSGKVLDYLLKMQGVDRSQVLCTNVVLCETGDKPPQEAIDACKPRLLAEIANCDTVLAAGKEAAHTLVGATSVHASRGYAHARNQQRIIVTSNPAVILRDDSNYPDLVKDFRLAIKPREQPTFPQVRWTRDISEASRWIDIILDMQPERLGCDIEARGVDGRTGLEQNAQVVCAGFSFDGTKAVVFGEELCTDKDFLGKKLSRLYNIQHCNYVWHNGKYDTKVLRYSGINAHVDEDTMLLSWVLDERPGQPEKGIGGHSLDYLLKDHLAWPNYTPQSVRQFKRDGIIRDHAELYKYNGYDSAGQVQLLDKLTELAKADDVYRVYTDILIDLNEAATRVEMVGMNYDVLRAADMLEEEVWPALECHKTSMRVTIGKSDYNPNSPVQTAKIFYDEWGLRHGLMRKQEREKIREGKEPRSTDKDVRKEISEGRATTEASLVHPDTVVRFVRALDDFSSLDKQRGTYLEGLVKRIWPNGKIYYELKIAGTETGRSSSANPNMQNITRTKPGLPDIRRLFHADPGCILIQADYSQAELRAIAYLSGDNGLKGIYSDPTRSLHKEVATDFYGAGYDSEQYTRTKNINFGVAYWQSAFGFAQMYQMPQNEAQDFIDAWFNRFPRVLEWGVETVKEMKQYGFLQSPFGHKRRFYVLTNENMNHAEKEAINFRPQNIAANLTFWAFKELTLRELDWQKAQVILTVHDNILINAIESYADEAEQITLQVMQAAPMATIGWDFPFIAESGKGYYWSEAK